MLKSFKYKKHRVSKYECPTRVICNGKEGTLVVGHIRAKQWVEAKLKRKLHPETKTTDTPFQWVFCEPISNKD